MSKLQRRLSVTGMVRLLRPREGGFAPHAVGSLLSLREPAH